ncbi:hypothetical protein Tco_1360462 [Tanacetum coccineum]
MGRVNEWEEYEASKLRLEEDKVIWSEGVERALGLHLLLFSEMQNNGRLEIGNPSSRHSVPFSSSLRICMLLYATTENEDDFFQVCNLDTHMNFSSFLESDSKISRRYLVAEDNLVESLYKASLFESFDGSGFKDGDVILTRSQLAVPIKESLVIEARLTDLAFGD